MRWTGFISPIALVTLASTALAQPGLVIDDFDSAINDETGGARALSLDVLANPFSQLTEFGVSPSYVFGESTGAAVFNSGLAAVQTGTIAWDNQGSGLDLNLTDLGGFELDFLQADQDFMISVVALDFTGGGSASWSGVVNASATAQTVSLFFKDFVLSGEFDTSSVDSITLGLNVGESPTSSLDFVLTRFRASDIIPAPGSVAVVGLSGLALARRRRR